MSAGLSSSWMSPRVGGIQPTGDWIPSFLVFVSGRSATKASRNATVLASALQDSPPWRRFIG
jgi:hypothetical protein